MLNLRGENSPLHPTRANKGDLQFALDDACALFATEKECTSTSWSLFEKKVTIKNDKWAERKPDFEWGRKLYQYWGRPVNGEIVPEVEILPDGKVLPGTSKKQRGTGLRSRVKKPIVNGGPLYVATIASRGCVILQVVNPIPAFRGDYEQARNLFQASINKGSREIADIYKRIVKGKYQEFACRIVSFRFSAYYSSHCFCLKKFNSLG